MCIPGGINAASNLDGSLGRIARVSHVLSRYRKRHPVYACSLSLQMIIVHVDGMVTNSGSSGVSTILHSYDRPVSTGT